MRWKGFRRHRADTQKVTGVYAAAMRLGRRLGKLKTEINAFAEDQAAAPR